MPGLEAPMIPGSASSTRATLLLGWGLQLIFRKASHFHEVLEQSNFQVFIAMDGYRYSSGTPHFHIHMMATADSGEHPASAFK